MTTRLAKPSPLMLGILSGLALVSLGVLPGNAQMSKTPSNNVHKPGAMSNSSSTMSPSSSGKSRVGSSSNSGTLTLGSTGQAVKDIQTSLKRMGFYNGPINGKFGHQTQTAVIKFQQSKKLPADGVVGPKTRAAMT